MTIMSSGGLQFGILEIVSSFGNVWADQSYWQVCHPPHPSMLSPDQSILQQACPACADEPCSVPAAIIAAYIYYWFTHLLEAACRDPRAFILSQHLDDVPD